MKAHVNTIAGKRGGARTNLARRWFEILTALAGIFLGIPSAHAQQAPRNEVVFKQVAPDLYFLYEFTGSNVVVMTTNDGVLVIDTRTHPRFGQDLVERIRKISDKPIKWLVNSHFHGDHHMGNV